MVEIADGQTVVTWSPALNDTENAKGVRKGVRTYRLFGKQTLDAQETWKELKVGEEADCRFFKVTVEMP